VGGLTISDAAKAANVPATAMMRLRAATWPSHQRLEKGLDVKGRFSNRDAYRQHLQRMWGFCAALEHSLTPQSFDDALPDYEVRRKLPLLARDLEALGASAISVSSLEICPSVLPASSPEAAFGCAYVWEGATLGGRVLLPLVEQQLGLTAEHGATFLASYGDEVTAMWLKFAAALNAFCGTPDRQAAAAEAAVTTFERLAAWLYRDSA
jgi:heme oxygenase (biliverdin-IX-beta and delta-forming)